MVAKNILCLNADLLYQVCSSQTKKEIEAEIGRFIKWNNRLKGMHSTRKRLNALLLSKPEFRSVFYYRTRKHKVLNALSRLFLRKAGAVEIGGDIGEGLLVSHCHCVVCPEKAGKNLRVGPGVVIYGEEEAPVIGNNVYIASDTVVEGDVHIGDNVIVGAGSVVSSDLAANGVYVGKPARFIKPIDNDAELLEEIM